MEAKQSLLTEHSRDLAEAQSGLIKSLQHVAQQQQRMEIRTSLPKPTGTTEQSRTWLRCSDLLNDIQHFAHWRELLAEWLVEKYGFAPSQTISSYIMTWYYHVPAFISALLFHHERRVPLLNAQDLAFRLSTSRPHPDAIAVMGRDFYCLPSDPESNLPEATVVADEHALAAVLRARYTGNIAQFIRVYSQLSSLGNRTLWAGATDALDNCLWLAGRHHENEDSGVADAALVLDEKHAPLTSASTLRFTENSTGQREWSRRRESCCFSYLLPNEVECGSCPRLRPKNK